MVREHQTLCCRNPSPAPPLSPITVAGTEDISKPHFPPRLALTSPPLSATNRSLLPPDKPKAPKMARVNMHDGTQRQYNAFTTQGQQTRKKKKNGSRPAVGVAVALHHTAMKAGKKEGRKEGPLNKLTTPSDRLLHGSTGITTHIPP